MHTLTGRTAAAARPSSAALALLPATALAATIIGGPGNERLRGTNVADTIDGNGGNDRIFGRGGDDRLIGGLGNDRVFGSRGNDTIRRPGQRLAQRRPGRRRDHRRRQRHRRPHSFDRIFGAAGNDTLRGGDSADRIYGGTGNDTSFGENGRDRMAGGTGDDTQDGGAGNDRDLRQPRRDTSSGGDGNDALWAMARGDVAPGPRQSTRSATRSTAAPATTRFRTRDGEVDRITCGDGNDRALLDDVDVITDATAAEPERLVRARHPQAARCPARAAPEDAPGVAEGGEGHLLGSQSVSLPRGGPARTPGARGWGTSTNGSSSPGTVARATRRASPALTSSTA